jgi:hypothetical protein
MRSMIRAGVAALALLVAANAAEAQGGGGGGGMGRGGNPQAQVQRQVDALFQGITLDAAQKAKVDTLITAQVAEQGKLRESMMGGGGDMQALRTKMTEMQTKFRGELKAVLKTDEEKAKFDENVKNLPPAGGRGRGGL